MASTDILTRSGKGSALTATEHDTNLSSFCGVVEEETGATHTIDHTDQNKTIQYNRGSAVAVTLTAAATVQANIDTDHFRVTLKNIGAGAVTVTRSGSDTIDGATSITLQQYDCVILQTTQAGSSWNIVSDNTSLRVAGVIRASAESGGGLAVHSDGNSDTGSRYVALRYTSGTLRALFGHLSSALLRIRNEIAGGAVSVTVRNAADTAYQDVLYGYADSYAYLHYAGSPTLRTITAATGGAQANNTSTGAGWERVLTTSDDGAGNRLSAAQLTANSYGSISSSTKLQIDASLNAGSLTVDTTNNRITNNTGRTVVVNVTLTVNWVGAGAGVDVDYQFYHSVSGFIGEASRMLQQASGDMSLHKEQPVTLADGEYVEAYFSPTSTTTYTTTGGGVLSALLV